MFWYLVIEPWSESGHVFVRHSDNKNIPYFGIGGCVWPLVDMDETTGIHCEMEDSRTYIDDPSGATSLICGDQALAKRYFDIASKHLEFVRLVEVTYGISDACDGVDIGSPEGRYSAIESEVGQIGQADKLNGRGLFDNAQVANAYLDERETFPEFETLEDLNVSSISVVGVRIVEVAG